MSAIGGSDSAFGGSDSAIGGSDTPLADTVGRSTRSRAAVQHAIAARRNHVQNRAELQQEMREAGHSHWYRMKVEEMEDIKAGRVDPETVIARYRASGSSTSGEGPWAPQTS